jgi:AraC-like DNA-binding protein
MICLQLNLIDDALQWISKGIRFRSTPFLFIQIDSTWDRIKNDPRFAELSARIGFPSPSGTPSGKLKYGKSRLDNQLLKSLQHQLNHALNEQNTYLDPTLSLSDLAEMCDVTVNQLSQYLNGHLGKTFYDYLNRFRLDHFLELAGSQEMEKLSILGLAYESGFNSKTTFNTFFKKELKVTPRAYLKQLGQSHSEK